MPAEDIQRDFPNLVSTEFRITSPATPSYNCIAWAAENTAAPWWPIASPPYYWPVPVPHAPTVQAFVEAFRTLGYEPCDNADLEPGFQKLAIYTDESGVPTHMARQLASGKWTSKLGNTEDIEHDTYGSVNGAFYGEAAAFMKRNLSVNA